MGIFKSIW